MSLEARRIRLLMALRRSGITDIRVLAALERTPREDFVPEQFHDQAYDDVPLPIGYGQTISQPTIVARMSQALQVGDRDKVLEIGMGSGYQTAILARLCRRVYAIERIAALHDEAVARLDALKLRNVTAKIGDGRLGWPEQAPFNRILVAAAAEEGDVPAALVDQLGEGGLMLIPVARSHEPGVILRIHRAANGIEEEVLDLARFVPLLAGEERGGKAPQ